jgi:hypothetical protein
MHTSWSKTYCQPQSLSSVVLAQTDTQMGQKTELRNQPGICKQQTLNNGAMATEEGQSRQ